jgi:hypothetical protein
MTWSLMFQILIIMGGVGLLVDSILDSVRKFRDGEEEE